MHEVKTNVQKNRLYITLKGFLSNEEVKQWSDETIQSILRLKPGFQIITDISEFSPASKDAAEYIKRAQLFASQHGVGTVVRVVKNQISSMQFKRMQREAHAKYQTIEVSTLEEAEQFLDAEGR